MENVEIFEMTLNDFEQIESQLISDFDDFWTPTVLKAEIMGENKQYIVAKQEGEIVGFAGVLQIFPEVELMNIVVKKIKRGKGIASKLLARIIENAKNNQFEKIFLEVNEKNKIARNLYEKADFLPIGKRENYYGSENAVMMVKKL